MAKFSVKFFKTKTGKYTLWAVGGLVVFYIAYRYISGVGGGSTVAVSNSGPSDVAVQAAAAQNLAQIQANAGVSATQIQSDAATAQTLIASDVANNQIQEQGNAAALAAGVANNTITADLSATLDSNKSSLANTTIASNTVLAQGKQQNDLLLGEMTIQQQEFAAQLTSSFNNNLLNVASTLTKKKTPQVIKYAIAGAITGITNSSAAQAGPASINPSAVLLGAASPTTLH